MNETQTPQPPETNQHGLTDSVRVNGKRVLLAAGVAAGGLLALTHDSGDQAPKIETTEIHDTEDESSTKAEHTEGTVTTITDGVPKETTTTTESPAAEAELQTTEVSTPSAPTEPDPTEPEPAEPQEEQVVVPGHQYDENGNVIETYEGGGTTDPEESQQSDETPNPAPTESEPAEPQEEQVVVPGHQYDENGNVIETYEGGGTTDPEEK